MYKILNFMLFVPLLSASVEIQIPQKNSPRMKLSSSQDELRRKMFESVPPAAQLDTTFGSSDEKASPKKDATRRRSCAGQPRTEFAYAAETNTKKEIQTEQKAASPVDTAHILRLLTGLQIGILGKDPQRTLQVAKDVATNQECRTLLVNPNRTAQENETLKVLLLQHIGKINS